MDFLKMLDEIASYEMRDYHGEDAVVDFFNANGDLLFSVAATSRFAQEMVGMMDMQPVTKGK